MKGGNAYDLKRAFAGEQGKENRMSAKDRKDRTMKYKTEKRVLSFLLALVCCVLPWNRQALADEKPTTLRLYRISYSEFHEGVRQFEKDHPEIKLEWTDVDYPSTEKLASDLLLREADCDLYHLDTLFIDERPIADKGYLVDLSGSEKIKQEIACMHPFIQKHVIRDGRIIGIPTDITFLFMSIRMDVWEEAGYTEDDIPHTFSEFLDFLDAFAERLADDPGAGFRIQDAYWDETLYNEWRYTEWIVELLFREYVKQMLVAEQPVRFTDPELVDLMNRCREVGHKLYLYEPMNQGKSFFVQTASNRWPQKATLLSIPIHEGQPNLISCNIGIDSVCSLSEHQDAAIELLEYIVSHPDEENAAYLYSDAEPLLNKDYEESKTHWNKKIADTEYALKNKKLSVEERDELEKQLKRFQDYLVSTEENRYTVSAEQLQQYQSYVPSMYVYHVSKFSNAAGIDWEVKQVLDRFAAGQVSAEDALKELDQKPG